MRYILECTYMKDELQFIKKLFVPAHKKIKKRRRIKNEKRGRSRELETSHNVAVMRVRI
jgi:hypothetical protein